MELLDHFESYINAQKNVGVHFILIGVLLLVIAVCVHFSDNRPLSSGLKLGALICGLLIIAGGLGYRYTETTLFKTQKTIFLKDQKEFRKIETERMEKVQKDYPVYQIVFSTFMALALLSILIVKNPYWHGVSFAVLILMLGVMIVEAFSKQSINMYYENLVN